MSSISNLQKARAAYQPKLPKALQGPVKAVEGAATQSVGNQAEIKELFPNTYGMPVVEFAQGTPAECPKFNVGVILSGGQAPGGHNVISGLFDGIKALNPEKNYFENMVAAGHFMWNDMLEKKFKKPVDNTEWYMTPQTVNAYYNPTTNEICFPAGILQYPFFDMEADDAFNYGAIGVVIGHEMTHGFDDQGRQFDKEGNFADWWAEGDADKFNDRVQVLVNHFDNIEVLPGLKANGSLTLGENIADHGGLMVAYQAFKNATKDAPLEDIYGLTPDQRFFLAYAGVWAGNIRDEEIRNRTKSDPHSLGRWRVNGTLPHIDAWYEAFGITPNDPMYIAPEQRAKIW